MTTDTLILNGPAYRMLMVEVRALPEMPRQRFLALIGAARAVQPVARPDQCRSHERRMEAGRWLATGMTRLEVRDRLVQIYRVSRRQAQLDIAAALNARCAHGAL